jgi:hypothetical protein
MSADYGYTNVRVSEEERRRLEALRRRDEEISRLERQLGLPDGRGVPTALREDRIATVQRYPVHEARGSFAIDPMFLQGSASIRPRQWASASMTVDPVYIMGREDPISYVRRGAPAAYERPVSSQRVERVERHIHVECDQCRWKKDVSWMSDNENQDDAKMRAQEILKRHKEETHPHIAGVDEGDRVSAFLNNLGLNKKSTLEKIKDVLK